VYNNLAKCEYVAGVSLQAQKLLGPRGALNVSSQAKLLNASRVLRL
jgi:hypothetical protein